MTKQKQDEQKIEVKEAEGKAVREEQAKQDEQKQSSNVSTMHQITKKLQTLEYNVRINQYQQVASPLPLSAATQWTKEEHQVTPGVSVSVEAATCVGLSLCVSARLSLSLFLDQTDTRPDNEWVGPSLC